jgi:hypothetical protein
MRRPPLHARPPAVFKWLINGNIETTKTTGRQSAQLRIELHDHAAPGLVIE